MIEDIKKDAADRMNKSVAALNTAMAKIRAGRAHIRTIVRDMQMIQ